jgi:hypothetical protein
MNIVQNLDSYVYFFNVNIRTESLYASKSLVIIIFRAITQTISCWLPTLAAWVGTFFF